MKRYHCEKCGEAFTEMDTIEDGETYSNEFTWPNGHVGRQHFRSNGFLLVESGIQYQNIEA